MKKSLLFTAVLLLFIFSKAQDFEGKINFIKKTLTDTSYLTYSIKDNQVRIDEYDKHKRLQRYFIVNIADKSVFAVNPVRKMYTNMPVRETSDITNNPEYQIIKSENHQVINGYKCYQWRVKNAKQNTEISYWIADENFSFFSSLLRTWNNTDKNQAFYLMIPDSDGRMPMLAVERTLLRDEKIRLAVTDINNLKIEDSIFKIPDNYQNLQQIR